MRDRVRVGESERDAPSDGLAPNSSGTPSGMLSPPFSPLECPLSPGELARRGVVTRTGSGISESTPPAADMAASLSNDDERRALDLFGVVGSMGEGMGIGMGSDEGDMGERCWGVPVR